MQAGFILEHIVTNRNNRMPVDRPGDGQRGRRSGIAGDGGVAVIVQAVTVGHHRLSCGVIAGTVITAAPVTSPVRRFRGGIVTIIGICAVVSKGTSGHQNAVVIMMHRPNGTVAVIPDISGIFPGFYIHAQLHSSLKTRLEIHMKSCMRTCSITILFVGHLSLCADFCIDIAFQHIRRNVRNA